MAEQCCTQEEMGTRARAEFERRRQSRDINQMMETALVDCSARDRCLTLCHTRASWEINPMGTMHGGLITYLLDAAMAIAVRSYTGDRITPTMDIHVNFIRAVKQNSTVYAKATILHTGRANVTVKSALWAGEEENPCAVATAMYYRADAASVKPPLDN